MKRRKRQQEPNYSIPDQTLNQTVKVARFKKWLSVLAAIASVIPLIIAFSNHFWPQRESTQATAKYRVSIVDAASGQPIRGAKVTLGWSSRLETNISDDRGFVHLSLQHQAHPIAVVIHVQAEGYEWTDRTVQFPPQDYDYNISLLPTRRSSGSLRLIDRKPYERIVSIGPIESLRGREFSSWFEVASEPPQPGYEIDLDPTRTFYRLSGDRSCGGWSECVWKEHTAQRVIFQFRVQGHSEWLIPQAANTQGILRVQYKPTTISLFIHISREHKAELKQRLDKLTQLPFFSTSIEVDNLEIDTQLQYFPGTSEEDALKVRETISEALGLPIDWLPVRQVRKNNPANYFGLWIKEPEI